MSWTETTMVSSFTRLHMEKDGRVDMDELANRAVSHACAYLGSVRDRTVKALSPSTSSANCLEVRYLIEERTRFP